MNIMYTYAQSLLNQMFIVIISTRTIKFLVAFIGCTFSILYKSPPPKKKLKKKELQFLKLLDLKTFSSFDLQDTVLSWFIIDLIVHLLVSFFFFTLFNAGAIYSVVCGSSFISIYFTNDHT